MKNYEAHILVHDEGFYITFENGLTVVVKSDQIQRSKNVEIALQNSNKNFINPRDYGIDVPDGWFDRDDIVGFVSMEELAEFLYKVSKAKVWGRLYSKNKSTDLCANREKEDTKIVDAADAIEKLNKRIDFLMNCIYEAEDALNRGTDNEWARAALEKANLSKEE